jgi:hypothetical protein
MLYLLKTIIKKQNIMKILNIKNTVLLFLLFFGISNSQAQGCSDAGFCSMGNGFKNQEEYIKNNLEVGLVYGVGEENTTIFSQYATYTRDLSDSFAMSLKLTSAFANGDLGSNGGLGDVFLSGNYKFMKVNEKTWSVLLGLKAPLTLGNDKAKNGDSLPMAYQSSLGTFDMIAGVNLALGNWDFNTAVQIPLSQNKNSYFLPTLAPGTTSDFVSTNLFERKSDALFRATYKFKTSNEKFTFKPNALFIYHLGEDKFINNFGQKETIKGSDGITINANIIVSYKLGSKSYLETSIASPLVVRKVKPDGLTRALTLGLAYKVNF